jgi:hypothetical protein
MTVGVEKYGLKLRPTYFHPSPVFFEQMTQRLKSASTVSYKMYYRVENYGYFSTAIEVASGKKARQTDEMPLPRLR